MEGPIVLTLHVVGPFSKPMCVSYHVVLHVHVMEIAPEFIHLHLYCNDLVIGQYHAFTWNDVPECCKQLSDAHGVTEGVLLSVLRPLF